MCGRFIYTDKEIRNLILLRKKAAEKYPGKELACGEVFPSQNMPALTEGKPKKEVLVLKWGIQLSFLNNPLINIRSEGIGQKPAFRDMFDNSRVIVPATGFYEWDKEKHKYLFTADEHEYFYFACLADNAGDNGYFAIITRDSYGCVKSIHERMPVILCESDALKWLEDKSSARALFNGSNMPLSSRQV